MSSSVALSGDDGEKLIFSGEGFGSSLGYSVITQKDLSEILGVHQTTISGVINKRADVRVSPETRKRILDAIKKYGYKPSLQAQILRQGKSKLIGVLNFRPGMMGVEKHLKLVEGLQEKGFSPLINEVFSPDRAIESLQLFLDLKVSGVLLKSMPRDIGEALKEKLLTMPVPVVSVEGAYIEGLPWIYPNKRVGMEALVLHLVKSGYRRLTMLPYWGFSTVSAPDYSHSTELIRGFQAAIDQVRDSVERVEIINRMYPSIDAPSSFERSYELGKLSTRELLAERKELPDVLVCNDDQWALGAMSACFDAGIKIPEEIGITGFGNHIVGQFSPIPLTTIDQPIAEIADKAVNMLCQRIAHPAKLFPAITEVSRALIVARQSTRTYV